MQTVSPPNIKSSTPHNNRPQDAKTSVYHNASPSRSRTSPYRTTAQYVPVVRPRPVCIYIYIYIYIDKRVALQRMSDMRVCHCHRRAALSAHINQLSKFLSKLPLSSHRPHYLWQDHCNDTEYLQPDREAEISCLKGGCNQRGPKQICRTKNKQDVHNDSYLGIDLVEPWGFSRRCAVKSGTGFARSTRDVIETRCVVGSLPLYVKDLFDCSRRAKSPEA